MLLNGGVGDKTLESPLDCKEIQPVHHKGDQSCVFIGRTDAEAETPILWPTWCEELTHLKRPWCWERLRAGEGDDRGWDGWMASLTQWTWVWVDSGSWCYDSWGRKESDMTEQLNWTELMCSWLIYSFKQSAVYNLNPLSMESIAKKNPNKNSTWNRALSFFHIICLMLIRKLITSM